MKSGVRRTYALTTRVRRVDGAALRRWRLERNWSQERCARAAGIRLARWKMFESGQHEKQTPLAIRPILQIVHPMQWDTVAPWVEVPSSYALELAAQERRRRARRSV